MGQDKAILLLGDQTLLQSVYKILQPLFTDIVISVRQTRAGIDWPQVCDNHLHNGPLAGLTAGLENSAMPWIFAVACDMPFITPTVINFLSQQREACQAVVPIVNGYPQPLAAFYAKECLSKVHACLNGSGKHSLRALLDTLQVCYVEETELQQVDPQLLSFFDLDTPQEVMQAINYGELSRVGGSF